MRLAKSRITFGKFTDDDLAYLVHIRIRAMQGDASKKEKPDAVIEVKRV